MNRPIFKSSELQKNFDEDGFAVFPLLNQKEIDYCLNLYNTVSENLPFRNNIHITFEQSNPEQHRYISSEICSVLKESLNTVFEKFEFFNGSFVVKSENSENSSVELHQDWTFVREDKGFRSGTLWIPLTDTTIENGAIAVIPRSHRWINTQRFAPRSYLPPIWIDHKDFLTRYLENIEMSAGSGIIWDHELFHASFPNFTSQPRPVISTIITGLGAAPSFFVVESGIQPEKVAVFEVDTKFFDEHTIKTMKEKYAKTGKITENLPSDIFPIIKKRNLDKMQILDLLSQSGFKEPNSKTVKYLDYLKKKQGSFEF